MQRGYITLIRHNERSISFRHQTLATLTVLPLRAVSACAAVRTASSPQKYLRWIFILSGYSRLPHVLHFTYSRRANKSALYTAQCM